MSAGAPDAVLVTARLRLRPHAVRDASTSTQIEARQDVARWLHVPQAIWPMAIVMHAARNRGRLGYRLAITRPDDDRLIGSIGLSGDARLSYYVDPAEWGQGIATEALATFLADCFTRLALPEVEAEVFDENTASIRVLEKLGFAHVDHSTSRRAGQLEDEPISLYRVTREALEAAA